ncbi:hypothetical protein [Coprococcus eutactus]|uniref:hypothetical protein n=2 Tax=Coprococcus TaxID=33042 RepID=UPI001A9A5FFE|nr:hypothetical protein [Coprococcus eutactus]
MARTNGKSFFVSFNRFGEEYNLLMGDNSIYTDTNGDKIPVVILQIMLLDERHMMFELARKQDINI